MSKITEDFECYANKLIKFGDEFNKYYTWILENMREIEITDMDLLPSDIRSYIHDRGLTTKGECYVNSARLATSHFLNEVTYCEGYFMLSELSLPFEHAWIKYNDRYYDITLNNDKSVNGYLLLKEFTFTELNEFMMNKGTYGPHLPDYINKLINLNINEDTYQPLR